MIRPIALATALAALLFAGCGEKSEPEVVAQEDGAAVTTTKEQDGGGGGQDGGGGNKATPEEEVEDAVIAVIGGGEVSSTCSGLVTERYVKSSYGDEQGCRAAVAKLGSFSVDVSQVKIKGSTATAKAKPAAGPNKNETITVELVEEQGTWKVDSAKSNAPAGP